MKKFPFLFAFILFAIHGFSQNSDSLRTVKIADSLLATSTELLRTGKNQDAMILTQQAVDLVKEKWGEYNVLYATALHKLATVYANLRQNDKAEEMYLKTIELREKLLGEKHLDYVQSLGNLANLYQNKRDFAKAEPLYLKSKRILGAVLGMKHPKYATTLNNLAILYYFQGDHTKAEPLYFEALRIWESSLGKEHSDYASALNGLGILYYSKGYYSKSEHFYLEAKEIREKVYGKEHLEYASSLNGLAILYRTMGEYDKAELLHLETKEIRAKVLGKKNPDYAASLNNLASLYRTKGDYNKAELMYLESKEIRANVYGKEHPLYAQSLNNLANLYYTLGNFDKAEPLFLESKEIRAKSLGKEHPDYALSLNNLSSLYIAVGDYGKAEALCMESKEILIKTVGKNHPEFANTLNNLGTVAFAQKDYLSAEQLFRESQSIFIKSLGHENNEYGPFLVSLVNLYYATKRIEESAAILLELNALNRRLIERSASYSSEGQLLAYLHTFDKPIAQFYSFCQSYPSPELIGAGYDNSLYFNGFLLENARHIARSVSEADSLTKETYECWQGCRRRLSNEYAKPIADRRYVAEVEAEAEGYEKTLARNLPIFGETRQAPRWQEVQEALKPGGAAMEFIHYRYYNQQPTDSTMYAALILRPGDSAPQFIPLFEKNQLKDLMRGASGGSNFLKINALYSQKSLYDLIWKPLEPMLTGIKTVYCAPSGLLHRLNLAAMATPEGKVYSERRQLVVMGSTRQLVVPNNTNKISTNDAYLAGGIRYHSDSTAIAYANRSASSRSIEPSALAFQPDSLSITRGGVLDYLPATAAEVREIGQTLQSADFHIKVDTGFFATEESFRLLGVGSPSPRIIHLATHGYFFPDPVASGSKQLALGSEHEPVFKMSEHPMIRSGMIMAGAKQAWLTGKHPEGMEDGVLTAYEISQMNLSRTELVVLSACETGLGDIVGNEGVYGLQRAFKIAGAKYLIMSLWKVDDRSTRAFMTTFYRHWLTENQTLPKAFRSTQQEMRVKYSGAYDWAGFVLIE